MDRDVALVLAGGLIGLASSIVALALQRLWAVSDRRKTVDREALDVTVRALLTWKEMALKLLSSGEHDDIAAARFRDLDLHWEVDIGLIPDREAASELLRLCKAVLLGPSSFDAMATSTRMENLEARVLNSAREKRRKIA
jgi:hypothetical protein